MGRGLVSLPPSRRRLPGNPRSPSWAHPPELIRRIGTRGPGLAEDDENRLRAAASGLPRESWRHARARVALEEEHKDRRGYVWADLGLVTARIGARASRARLAEMTSTPYRSGV